MRTVCRNAQFAGPGAVGVEADQHAASLLARARKRIGTKAKRERAGGDRAGSHQIRTAGGHCKATGSCDQGVQFFAEGINHLRVFDIHQRCSKHAAFADGCKGKRPTLGDKSPASQQRSRGHPEHRRGHVRSLCPQLQRRKARPSLALGGQREAQRTALQTGRRHVARVSHSQSCKSSRRQRGRAAA